MDTATTQPFPDGTDLERGDRAVLALAFDLGYQLASPALQQIRDFRQKLDELLATPTQETRWGAGLTALAAVCDAAMDALRSQHERATVKEFLRGLLPQKLLHLLWKNDTPRDELSRTLPALAEAADYGEGQTETVLFQLCHARLVDTYLSGDNQPVFALTPQGIAEALKRNRQARSRVHPHQHPLRLASEFGHTAALDQPYLRPEPAARDLVEAIDS